MILSGDKKEEYRDLSPYWHARFRNIYPLIPADNPRHIIVETIIFSNGYAKDRRQFEIKFEGIYIGHGLIDWGASPEKQYFILQLGSIIQCNCKS